MFLFFPQELLPVTFHNLYPIQDSKLPDLQPRGCARLLLEGKANVRAMTVAKTSAAHLAAARGVPWYSELNDEKHLVSLIPS